MVVVLSSHAASTGLNHHNIMTGSVLLPSIAEGECTILETQLCIMSDEHTYLRWREQLHKHKFPQGASANLETSCLFVIGDISRKLRLRAVSFLGVLSPWHCHSYSAPTSLPPATLQLQCLPPLRLAGLLLMRNSRPGIKMELLRMGFPCKRLKLGGGQAYNRSSD
jgi:hypothetical protein